MNDASPQPHKPLYSAIDRHARCSTQLTLLTDLCHRLVELNKHVSIGCNCLAEVQLIRRHYIWHVVCHSNVSIRRASGSHIHSKDAPLLLRNQLKDASGDDESAKSFSRRDKFVVNLLVCAWSSLCEADLFSLDLLLHTT